MNIRSGAGCEPQPDRDHYGNQAVSFITRWSWQKWLYRSSTLAAAASPSIWLTPGTGRKLKKAGIGFSEHDERYAYGREWISVVEPLTHGETVSFQRQYFHVDDYARRPADPLSRPAPHLCWG